MGPGSRSLAGGCPRLILPFIVSRHESFRTTDGYFVILGLQRAWYLKVAVWALQSTDRIRCDSHIVWSSRGSTVHCSAVL